MRTLLIDGDSIAYRAASVANQTGEDPVAKAVNMVEGLRRRLNAGRAIIALSARDRRYWRHELDPNYKAGRPEPMAGVLAIRAGIAGGNRFVKEVAGMEADDLLGICATDPNVRGDKVIVADDKHLLQIPGLHHRPNHYRPDQVVRIELAEAECRHLQHALAAYCDRVAEKTAEKIVGVMSYISSPAGVWRAVVDAFEKAGHAEADALRAARIVRVLRAGEFNAETLEPVLWTPPGDNSSAVYQAPPSADVPPTPVEPVGASLFQGDGPQQHGWTR